MQQLVTTTTDSHRSSPNPTTRVPYRFALHHGLASELAGLDLAQIWLGLARSGLPFFFFLCFIQLLIKCYSLNQFKNVLGLRKI
jgi:hypothetical protein